MGFNVLDTLNSKSRQQAQTGQLSNWYANMTYEETKAGIRDGITKIKESFVEVGYYLRKIQRTEEYKADGYKDIWEFADQEYGLHRSTASRWMKMNELFSQNGESPYLKEEYQQFGKSQLQEMLYLEEDTRQQVTKDMTVREIRELRKTEESIENPMQKEIPGQMEIHDYPEVVEGVTEEPFWEPQTITEEQQEEPREEIIEAEYKEAFPGLKNKEEREAFLNDYQKWPVWCRNTYTEETFYRYDLPDGSAIIVKEYPYTSWKGESEGKEKYLLKPDTKHFADGKTNITALIEHLKEVGKWQK